MPVLPSALPAAPTESPVPAARSGVQVADRSLRLLDRGEELAERLRTRMVIALDRVAVAVDLDRAGELAAGDAESQRADVSTLSRSCQCVLQVLDRQLLQALDGAGPQPDVGVGLSQRSTLRASGARRRLARLVVPTNGRSAD